MAAEHAESLARRAPLAKAVPAKPLGRALAVLAALAAAIGLLALAMPDLVKTEWNRFTRPLADVPPYSPLRFTVTPGDTRVLYGEDLEIGATVEGGVADHLELVLEGGDGSQSSLPMFSESERHVAGRALQADRADRLFRPLLPRPQREIHHRDHHRAADRDRPRAGRAAGVCRPAQLRRPRARRRRQGSPRHAR